MAKKFVNTQEIWEKLSTPIYAYGSTEWRYEWIRIWYHISLEIAKTIYLQLAVEY